MAEERQAKKYLDLAGLQAYDGKIKAKIAADIAALENGKVKDNADAITKLNGADTVEGSVDNKIKAAITEVNGAATTLGNKVDANTEAIAAINNETTGIKAVAAADAKAKADQALIDAKAYADQKVSDEATAREAVNTALEAYKAENDPKVTANTQAIAKLNGGEAEDGSVAKSVKDAINDFATKISDDGTVNTFKELVDYAATSGAQIGDLISKEAANEAAITTLDTKVGTLPEGKTDVVSYLKGEIEAEASRADAAEKANAQKIADETAAREAVDTRLQKAEEALGLREGEEATEGVAAQIAAAVKVEKERADAAEKVNAAAIAKEATDRASAITAAIEALDAEVAQVAGADGLALKVTEVDGKITAIEGSIAANTYDSYGAAKEEATAVYNAIGSIEASDITALF